MTETVKGGLGVTLYVAAPAAIIRTAPTKRSVTNSFLAIIPIAGIKIRLV